VTHQMTAYHAAWSIQTQGQECDVVLWMRLSLLSAVDRKGAHPT